ncbi:hypothetical protein PTTG_11378 [Puccinia triticina 1-1 BBBD Race 1]|uniref:FxsA cytoplasmic membrane protein n=1 Tax=Puccinia triticina (isolate 1-1 / race 1 (BBBD)) TaxID=630390 RepID=A0A0C4FDS2_PUCT1|nr:hypothetical protein PTTG_11378 [Puccinia triticina 1-1 BBBD Race 1]
MQQKMAAGESPAAEMIKSVSLIIGGILLIIPGFFTDFLGLLLLFPPVQKLLTLKLMPHLRFNRMPGGGFSTGPGNGETFDGEFQRKDDQRDRQVSEAPSGAYTALRFGKNHHSPASITMAYRLFHPTIASSSKHSTPPITASAL